MLNYRTGDLLESGADYICHQCNCKSVMRSGVAKQIRDKWPIVYAKYRERIEEAAAEAARLGFGSLSVEEMLLGNFQTVKLPSHGHVINMFAQLDYGYDGKRYTSYDAFYDCLERMSRILPKNATIAFPYKIGCDRGGADWDIISKMIEKVLGDFNVTIYRLENLTW